METLHGGCIETPSGQDQCCPLGNSQALPHPYPQGVSLLQSPQRPGPFFLIHTCSLGHFFYSSLPPCGFSSEHFCSGHLGSEFLLSQDSGMKLLNQVRSDPTGLTPGPTSHPHSPTCDLTYGNKNGPDTVVRAGQRCTLHEVRREVSVWPLLWGILHDHFCVCPDPLSQSPYSVAQKRLRSLSSGFCLDSTIHLFTSSLMVGCSLPRPQGPPAPPARPLLSPIALCLSLQPCILPLTPHPPLLYKYNSPHLKPSLSAGGIVQGLEMPRTQGSTKPHIYRFSLYIH